MSWEQILVIAAGGAVGAVARFIIDGMIRSTRLARGRRVPWATVVINISGSFILGIVVALVGRGLADPLIGAGVGTGILGGYTTFSTFSVETARLLEKARLAAVEGDGRYDWRYARAAAVNVLVTLGGAIAGALLGIAAVAAAV